MLGVAGRESVKRTCALILMLGWLLSAFPARADALAPDRRAEADAFFAALFRENEIIGGAVLVSRDGERIYDCFYGWGDKGKTRPVTEDTVYKVASVTKLVTAIGVMQLVEEGKITLDDPLPAEGSGFILNPWHPASPVTLRQVMSHTSSIAGSAPYTGYIFWQRMDTDSKTFTPREPGAHYEYSNLNGGILGSLIERMSGESLNDYMTARVFSPLKINAAYAATLLPDAAPLSNTFQQDGTIYRSARQYLQTDEEYDDTCDPDRHYRTSVGSLYISLKGLETLSIALAGSGTAEEVFLLSPESVEEMRRDQALIPGSSVTGETPYGLCLYRHPAGGKDWYGHQGRWEGLLVDVFFEPESGKTVVLVLNGVQRKSAAEVAPQAQQALDLIASWP